MISTILLAIVLSLYLINKEPWSFYKRISCIILALWLFNIPPTVRYYYLNNKDKSIKEWFKVGLLYSTSELSLSILISPYFGIKYFSSL